MKFIVRLFGFILALAALLAAIGFLLPKEQHVERSLQLKASPEVIQPYLTTPRLFNSWSPWAGIDPNTTYSYSGPDNGVGAKMAWSSNSREVGTGVQEVTAVSADRVDLKLDFGAQGVATSYYLLEPNEQGTKVTWGFDADMGINPMARWMGMMMDKMVGEKYVEGLNKLNAVTLKTMETQQKSMTASKATLRLVDTETTTILFTRGEATSDTNAISAALAPAFNKLMEFAQANQIEVIGMPLAINEEYDAEADIYRFSAGLPINAAAAADIEVTEEVGLNATYNGRAVQAEHIGSYANLQQTYKKIDDYIANNNLTKSGFSWEHYVTDPTLVAPEEIVTMIYQPVTENISADDAENIEE